MNVSDYADIGVQLAGQSKDVAPTLDEAVASLQARGFYFELKFDGVRCLALIDGNDVQLVNRNGANITFRYPDVVSALRADFGSGRALVLDGELVCYGSTGKPDFAGIHLRDAQSKPVQRLVDLHPTTYMTFDVLHFEGDDVRKWPWRARMELARTEAQRVTSRLVQWSTAALDGAAMWAFVKEHGLEGLIAKDPKQPYKAGNRRDWVKIKQAFTVSATVTGYKPGKGKRANGIGALSLSLVEPDGSIFEWGEVGTGFRDSDLALLKTRLDRGDLLVVDVEVNAITRDRRPRFPSWRGIRSDINPTDCLSSQLNHVPMI